MIAGDPSMPGPAVGKGNAEHIERVHAVIYITAERPFPSRHSMGSADTAEFSQVSNLQRRR